VGVWGGGRLGDCLVTMCMRPHRAALRASDIFPKATRENTEENYVQSLESSVTVWVFESIIILVNVFKEAIIFI
jgi:hypothetical protein